MADEFVRVVRVQTFHSARGGAADPTRVVQAVVRITTRTVVGIGGSKQRREVVLLPDALRQLTHHTGCFEPSDGLRRAATREPIQRRERHTVDERVSFDHGRLPTPTTKRDAHLAAQPATELKLDGGAVSVRDVEAQPSLFLTFRLMSA